MVSRFRVAGVRDDGRIEIVPDGVGEFQVATGVIELVVDGPAPAVGLALDVEIRGVALSPAGGVEQ